ncbi:arginase family protein [Conexibacter stalactiti]|uniref:Arginase family protein n=1 Tax=Conexibacter stalactiti TaxID=1940611 RepID=A0ABU4HQS8_9ACTN|nr:arginase family protein [Conexibacter stalactiti]MDW5595645.1 arginase family protein [Conexibacter stalactiti]MEC5036287.1 arginase family protein [Conexibacter stalactiti]
MSWTLLGAPLDSAGAGEGEERAPAALRAAGIAEAVGAGADLGDVTELLRPAERDPRTGVIAYAAVLDASVALRDAVARVLRGGERPLVLGGDCSLLPGALAGCRIAGLEPGLWMVDGHPDAMDGASSPTGEAADMDFAIVCGRGPTALVELAAPTPPPLLAPARAVVLGLRPRGMDPGNDDDLALMDETVWWRDAPSIAAAGPRAVGEEAARRLEAPPVHEDARADDGAVAAAWLHLDLDVLDAAVMPAVSYPQPQGLTWEQLEQLVTPLAASPALVGMSVSDLQADADPDGALARRTVELLGRVLAR